MRIGFIGLGTMGKNAAASIRRHGFDMVVYDIRPEAMEGLAAMGAAKASNPALSLKLQCIRVGRLNVHQLDGSTELGGHGPDAQGHTNVVAVFFGQFKLLTTWDASFENIWIVQGRPGLFLGG